LAHSWIDGTTAVEEQAAAGGEAAAFGFVGRGDVFVFILNGGGDSRIDGKEVVGIEGRSRDWRGLAI